MEASTFLLENYAQSTLSHLFYIG